MTRRALLGSIVVAVLLLTACSSSRTGASGVAATSPPPRTEPYLVMTGAGDGVAVWPSGPAWLLLSTRDGFAHVTNRTPQGVDTGGGLAVATAPGQAIAVVGAHERLVRSPVVSAGPSWRWDADELPGAVSDSRSAASASPRTVVTTARSGTLEERTGAGWQTLTSAASLGAGVQLDAVTWSGASSAWLTGTASDGAAAYATRDGGASWSPVAAASGKDVAALAPCGAGQGWLLPVLRGGTLRVLRTSDGGLHWTPGAALASATSVFGCAGSTAWAVVRKGNSEHLVSSADGGASWRDRGVTPADVVDLSPTGSDSGYAVTDDGNAALWRVAGARFERVSLPGWVASIGDQTPDDS